MRGFRCAVTGRLALLAIFVTAPASAQTLQIVDNLPGAFVDISGTGVALGLVGDLETIFTIATSNAVFPSGDVVIANNGGVGFDSTASNDLAAVNPMIPSGDIFGGSQALLPFMDDIGNTIGDVYALDDGATFIVQWETKQFEGSKDTARFQLKVFNGVTFAPLVPVFAQLIYEDIEQPRAGGGVSATIGYQNGAAGLRAFNDVQWSFNTAGAVGNGTVLSLIPEPGTLLLLSLGGILLARRRR